MDPETQKVTLEQDKLRELVGHEGWKIARRVIADKILDLQNAFNIDSRTATTMLRDLQARKYAANIIWEWLREIEGSATQAADNKPESKSPHIVNLEG